MFGRRRIATLVAEFLGTGVLTLIILSVQRSQIGVPFFVALAAGFAVVGMTFAFANTSGAHFNPALTLGMWTARRISTLRAIGYIGFQLLGAYSAYLLYTYFVDNRLQEIGGEFNSRILVAEAVGAAILSFGFAAALFQRLSLAARAAAYGLSYILAIIAASSVSIGLINPAVAFGVQAVQWGTYILGPLLGAIIGVNLYSLLFADRDNDNSGLGGEVVKTASVTAVSETATETTVTSAKSATVKKPRATRAKASTARTGSRATTKKAPAKKATSTRRKKA